MIKTEGASTYLRGDTPTLFIELVFLLHTFLERLEEDMSKEGAQKTLALIGQLALLDENELEGKLDQMLEDFQNATRM